MRRTGGQYLPAGRRPSGRRPRRGRRGGPTRRPAPAAVCGAPRSTLSAAATSPRADLVDLGADRDHRVAEPVELAQVLALGRLDHQGAGHRERHRRRVEAVVDEPLGDVVDGDAGVLGEAAQVEDALVGDQAVGARSRAPGSARAAGPRRSWRSARPPRWPGAGRRRPSAARTPRRSAGCPPSRTARPRPGRPRSRARPPGRAGGWAGTARGARARRPGRRRGRRRRAGCRRSCAGSGARRRRRTCPGWASPTSALRLAPST